MNRVEFPYQTILVSMKMLFTRYLKILTCQEADVSGKKDKGETLFGPFFLLGGKVFISRCLKIPNIQIYGVLDKAVQKVKALSGHSICICIKHFRRNVSIFACQKLLTFETRFDKFFLRYRRTQLPWRSIKLDC